MRSAGLGDPEPRPQTTAGEQPAHPAGLLLRLGEPRVVPVPAGHLGLDGVRARRPLRRAVPQVGLGRLPQANPAPARRPSSSRSAGNSLPSGSGGGSGASATKTSRPSRAPPVSTRRSSASAAALSEVVHSTPRHHAASNDPSGKGRRWPSATTDGRPNSRADACTAAAMGSAHTGRSPRSAASQPAGPPTPAPESSTRTPGRSSIRSASQRSAPSLPLPRHPAGIACSGPSARTASSVHPATVSNSASIASLSSSLTPFPSARARPRP